MREQSCILQSCCLSTIRRNSVLEELRVRRLAGVDLVGVHRVGYVVLYTVQSPNQVKITDFGLAKLLDYNEDGYRAAGGKV